MREARTPCLAPLYRRSLLKVLLGGTAQPESSLSVWRFYGLPEPSEGYRDSPTQDQSWSLAPRGLLDSLFGDQLQGRCPGTGSSLATTLAALRPDDLSLQPSRQAATVPGQLHLPVAATAAYEPPASAAPS